MDYIESFGLHSGTGSMGLYRGAIIVNYEFVDNDYSTSSLHVSVASLARK